ncbi:MAG: hypothetical protein BWX86_00586 [Verrucomicrobia bacterium ADurb.Bin122]|nr:MAG: hypothetical protein BWX86_00586 [Verrucomicrobia bacterium ADurb.Bin122]
MGTPHAVYALDESATYAARAARAELRLYPALRCMDAAPQRRRDFRRRHPLGVNPRVSRAQDVKHIVRRDLFHALLPRRMV